MIAELQQAVANYAHALDELNVPELEAVLTEDTTWTFTMPGHVAQQVGYSSAYAFSKAFRREYGVPPGKYRHRARPPSTDQHNR